VFICDSGLGVVYHLSRIAFRCPNNFSNSQSNRYNTSTSNPNTAEKQEEGKEDKKIVLLRDSWSQK